MNEPDLSPLMNRGVMAINAKQRSHAQRTIVVLGVARSGTSLIAGALQRLGIPMGNFNEPVYEDLDLAAALDAKDWKRLDQAIAERNVTHTVWGWKRPAFLHHAKKVHARLRNPEYIVVFRDLFAIASRNYVSVRQDVVEGMRNSLKEYGEILQFLDKVPSRALLISYEKALLRPDDCIAALARFAGVGDAVRIAEARAFVQPEPEAYLLRTRATDGRGYLDVASTRTIAGWAFAPDHPRPVQVDIYVNGGLLATVTADQPRPDLKVAGIHPTGVCGFRLALKGDEGAKAGDHVTARVSGDNKDLKNSPLKVQAPQGYKARADHGALDRANSEAIVGWAVGGDRAEPVHVEILANGNVLATVAADRVRQDILSAGIHPTGKCGFRLPLNGSEGLRPGDLIAARIAGQQAELLNSPRPLLATGTTVP